MDEGVPQFASFFEDAHSVFEAFIDEIQVNPPMNEVSVPTDLTGLLTIVRRVAEDLILCASVEEAKWMLRRDQEGALSFWALTNLISDSHHMIAVRRAYASTLHPTTILPCAAFSAVLIELCNGLELVPPEA